MRKKNKQGKLIYGIIGVGRFGYALAEKLYESGSDMIILDANEEKIAQAREFTENAFIVKNLDKKTLLDTGIQSCDVAVICIGEHIDTSILTTLHLVSMNIPKVIAKASSAEHGEILKKLGAEIVYPERDMAQRLAQRLEISQVLDFVQLSEKINITKNKVPDAAVGKTVLELNLRSQFGLNIIAIENLGGVTQNISPQYVFRKDDILFLCGSMEGIERFSQFYRT